MTLIDWLTELTRPLHQQAYDTALHFSEQWKATSQQVTDCNTDLLTSQQKVAEMQDKLAKLSEVVDSLNIDSKINEYLQKAFVLVPNIAYTGKRTSCVQTLKSGLLWGEYNVYINEFITPNAWEVVDFKRSIIVTDDFMFMQAFARKFKPLFKWFNELDAYASGDEYLYPAEVLTYMIQRADCEDVAFLTASMRPDICGVAYGIYHNTTEKKDFGHAYPVFVYNNELYVVEFTTNQLELVKLPDSRYDTYFIVTQDKTYHVKNGVSFGTLAKWD